MRKIIGLGETIFDIIFQNTQPTASVPGGSTFNGIISLGRTGIPVSFISETGNDHVGEIILNFMRENGVSTDYMQVTLTESRPSHWPSSTSNAMPNTNSIRIIRHVGWKWTSHR